MDENDNIVTENMLVTKDIKLKALWISKDAKINTVKFDTDGGIEIKDIIIENGKVILFPTTPTKEGYVFGGWVDSNGNSVTKDTIINDNIIIKALWKKPYTCPSNCTPVGNGSTCTKELTTSLIDIYGCPSGYNLISGKCLDKSKAVMAGQSESCSDGSTPVNGLCINQSRDADSAWDCTGKEYFENGKCIMTPTYSWVCSNSNYYKYDDCYGMGCIVMCAPQTSKVATKGCPNGYIKDGNICKKTQTINCPAN